VINRGPEARRRCTCCPAVVPQHVERGGARRGATGRRRRPPVRGPDCSHTAPTRRCVSFARHLDVRADRGRRRARAPALTCENETNVAASLYGAATPQRARQGRLPRTRRARRVDAVASEGPGTKCAAHYVLVPAPGEARVVRLRFCAGDPSCRTTGAGVRRGLRGCSARGAARPTRSTTGCSPTPRARSSARGAPGVRRAALDEAVLPLRGATLARRRSAQPPPPKERASGPQRRLDAPLQPRRPLDAGQVGVPVVRRVGPRLPHDAVRAPGPDFAKHQLLLLLREWYMHPNGQLPAYEWNFGDVNPPVHAWACLARLQDDRRKRQARPRFLERAFQKLLLNFTWWVNRKDADGRHVFGGGFLGLDNIGVFDRSASRCPTAAASSRPTAPRGWPSTARPCSSISLELARTTRSTRTSRRSSSSTFVAIADAMNALGGTGSGTSATASTTTRSTCTTERPERCASARWSGSSRSSRCGRRAAARSIGSTASRSACELVILTTGPTSPKRGDTWVQPSAHGATPRRMLSLPSADKPAPRALATCSTSASFSRPSACARSRSGTSREPSSSSSGAEQLEVRYVPAESDSRMFGGNSNWRGPVWMPVNYLLIESLEHLHEYFGDDLRVECPTGSGRWMNLHEVALELCARLSRLFLPDASGRRPCHTSERWVEDEHLRALPLFYEYFHGDSGRGCGASHQTGWTALVAECIERVARERRQR
jgi:hypothetical protein